MTIAEAIRELSRAGVPSPEYDARALAQWAESSGADFPALVAERARRVPLQHLLGSTGFRYLELLVGPGVFVPRPETEVVVDAALRLLGSQPDEAPLVVDLCAGSGAMGLSIAQERPAAVVHLVERDPRAFQWLQRNTVHNALTAHLHLEDAATALPQLDGTVDLVVSNPPYVAEHERDWVDPEVRDHDPELAVFAGDDGLEVIRVVEATARRLLRPGGWVVLEHSDRQGESVPDMLRHHGWRDVADHADLVGRPRFASARLAP